MNGSARIDAWIAVNQRKVFSGEMSQTTYFAQLARVRQRSEDGAIGRSSKGFYRGSLSLKHCAAGNELRTKALEQRIKSGDANGDTFVLYGARWKNIDRQNEILMPGCIENADEFERDGVIILNHVMADLPVASPVHCEQDSTGFKVIARWHTTPAAQDCKTVVRERMEAGKTVGCSIGYQVLNERYEYRGSETIRIISSINVYEISLTNLPANPEAMVIEA